MSENEFSALPQSQSVLPFLSTDDTELVSLNLVLEHALLPYHAALKNGSLVARCEPLPAVKGSLQGLKRVFESVLSLVLKPFQSRMPQYLHVDCEEEVSEVLDLSVENGYRFYHIQFKTNKKEALQDTEAENEQLQACHEILKASKGTLRIFCTEGEGCLFSILLQGKMN